MQKIQICTDSASDISVEDEKKYQIEILPYRVAIGQEAYVSRKDFTNEEFYKMLEASKESPSTTQITTFEFQDYYEQMEEKGVTDLIMILINSKGSATYENANYAYKLYKEENPETKLNVYTFDSKGYSAMYGSVVVDACVMQQEGKSAQEICKFLEESLQNRIVYFGMYSLKFAAKSGRIPSAAAFVGEALGLKPIMKIWDREIITFKKARGEGRLIPTLCDIVCNDIEPGSPYEIVYGSDPSVIEKATQVLEAKLGYGPRASYQIGAAIAINAGPKVIGVAFNKKK